MRTSLVAADGFEGAVDEGADAGVALEVLLDVGAGLALVDAELRGEAEGRDAVDDAEVDGLGAVARLLVELGDGDAEDLRGGEGVDVLAGAVGVEQERVLREVGHEAQLDLRVVGGEEQVAGGGDEGGANLLAERGADGDVLQVRVGGREAAGGRADLVEGGVDAAFGVDEVGQRIEIGGAELGELAMLEHERGDGVMLGELLQHVLRGGDDLALAVLRRLGEGILLKSTSPSCLGELRLKRWPEEAKMRSARVSISTARRVDMAERTAVSMRTPACSMRRRTGTSGRSMVR